MAIAHKMKALFPYTVHACSVLSDSATPWAVVSQAPLFMEFSRQEYWSGLPFPHPGDLPNPGIEPESPLAPTLTGRFFTTELPGKTSIYRRGHRRLDSGTGA